jgi:4-amino-4-deoxy-L-arabinose transferase-like glycosyltransferase
LSAVLDAGAASAAPATVSRARWSQATVFIVLLLAVFTCKQLFSVAAFYPFSGHDEMAHYSYIRTLATEGRIPVLPDLEEWRSRLTGGQPPPTDQIPNELYPYCRFVLDWYCEPENVNWRANPPRIVTVPGYGYYPSGYQYVANHPPLYYALMTPVYLLSQGASVEVQHYLLRMAAIPFGLVTVFAAFRTVRLLFPRDWFMVVTVPAFVAFQPQISYEAAMVNNDIVAIAIFSLLIWGTIAGMKSGFSQRLCLLLGVTLGAGLLVKSTTATIAPVIGLAMLWTLGIRDWRRLISRGLMVGIPAAILAAPWYLHLYRTYGDLSGLKRVAELQYWNAPMGSFWSLLTDPEFVLGRFRESWGEYGWRLIHFRDGLLWAVAVPMIAGTIGVGIYAIARWRGVSLWSNRPTEAEDLWQGRALWVLALACAVSYLAVVQFGTQFALAQARYFFPVVNAAAILVMLGLRTLIPWRWRPAGQGVVLAALIALNVYIFAAYVLPFTTTFDQPTLPWVWRD